METYISLPNRVVQIVQDTSSALIWQTFAAVLLFSCLATRIITGLQSQPRKVVEGEPHPVRKLPYWIPWLGHTLSFVKGHRNFVAKAGETINEPVVALHIGGQTHNMILSPSITKALFAHRGASTDFFVFRIMETVFGDGGLVRNMDHRDLKSLNNALALIMREPYVTDTSSAAVKLIKQETANFVSFSRSVVDQAVWERGSEISVIDGTNPPVCEANLFSLTRNFVGYITTCAFMGRSFVDFYPGLLEDLFALDNAFFLLVAGAPKWLPMPSVSAAYAARERLQKLIAALHISFAAVEDGRDPGVEFRDLDDLSEMIKLRMRTWRKAGYSPIVGAKGDLAVLWAMNVNSTNIVFWNLLHIYSDPDLLSALREEMAPFVKASRLSPKETGLPFTEPPRLSLDLEGLLNSCPLLRATYLETLRMDSNSTSYRELSTDVTLTESAEDAAKFGASQPRSYHFRKGDILAVPHGAHQIDPRYYPSPDKFDPYRFIVTDPDTGKKSADMQTIRPFGGGASMCKGRIFADREVLAFTAAILALWDIEPVSNEGWTNPGHKPGSSAYLPAHEVRVRLKHRI
ncbi:hypothetical protein VTN77DRAFT_3319 [Rasamsonia byssochlamydoides]|uniref:uncharacterized protein n=1 Tax=Rasamsonia byssochlamydoides TaxID=89139 RepID=UPI0037433849